MKRVLTYVPIALIALLTSLVAAQTTWAVALISKATTGTIPCPWAKLLAFPASTRRFVELQKQVKAELHVDQTEGSLERISTPTRPFWIKKAGSDLDGFSLLAYVIAEQQWISEYSQEYSVRRGDVVVDVGAHIGTFGDDALRRGAARVVMVEPDPVNVECIRRNFASEIAAGRVIVIPEGAWSKTDTLKFSIGEANSGTGSFVVMEEGRQNHQDLQVPVRPLDDMLRRAGIDHVDFIKMDIEGAEREALKGAAKTLAASKPRLMMDMYHLKDDAVVLPPLIEGANPGYRSYCSVCSVSRWDGDNRIIPYATFFY